MEWPMLLVPLGEDRVTPRHRSPDITPDVAVNVRRQGETSPSDIGDVIREAIRDVVAPLSAQLEHERQRADRAERRADEAMADNRDLRAQLNDALTAERIARDEAAGLRVEQDARRVWGLRRRLRWALGRKR
jgi:hypothetical protein